MRGSCWPSPAKALEQKDRPCGDRITVTRGALLGLAAKLGTVAVLRGELARRKPVGIAGLVGGRQRDTPRRIPITCQIPLVPIGLRFHSAKAFAATA